MWDMRLIAVRAPDQCGNCGGLDLKHTETARSSGAGITWYARCRVCGAEWFAMERIRPELWEGPLVEWRRYERPVSMRSDPAN